jgi:NET1-associated nuclear protein 1 (U3 small nucleolar RNA-associated protein 17)
MMMHWHAHAVSSISFSPNGAYLLSAGEEAVLVLWQLQSGHKEFVPRVGAPILSVSVAKSVQDRTQEYLLVLADASLVVVDSASLKIVRAFSRLKIGISYFLPLPLPLLTPNPQKTHPHHSAQPPHPHPLSQSTQQHTT